MESPGHVSVHVGVHDLRVYGDKICIREHVGCHDTFNTSCLKVINMYVMLLAGQIQRVVEQRDALPLLFPRHDLGVTYTASAATHQELSSDESSHAHAANNNSTGTASDAYHQRARSENTTDDVGVDNDTKSGLYVASGAPGARLPHAWLQGRTREVLQADVYDHHGRADDLGDEYGEIERVSSLDLVSRFSGNVIFLRTHICSMGCGG